MSCLEFDRYFIQYKNVLFACALKLTQKPEDAKDLVQETALRAFANRNQFKAGSNFRAWTLVIMRNTYINQWRKKKKRTHIVNVDEYLYALPNKTVPNTGEESLMLNEMEDMIDNIGEAYSVPIQMLYQGYQYKEIASYLMLPIGTIKSRIFFARQQIKKQMKMQYI